MDPWKENSCWKSVWKHLDALAYTLLDKSRTGWRLSLVLYSTSHYLKCWLWNWKNVRTSVAQLQYFSDCSCSLLQFIAYGCGFFIRSIYWVKYSSRKSRAEARRNKSVDLFRRAVLYCKNSNFVPHEAVLCEVCFKLWIESRQGF